MCNKQELSRRLFILQEHVLYNKLLPLIQIYIQTLRVSAPEIQVEKLDLDVSESHLIEIFSLLSGTT